MVDGSSWPVLRTFNGAALEHLVLPLGGIGTGTVGLAGNGALRDWELTDRPAKGFSPPLSLVCLRTVDERGMPWARVLEGPSPLASRAGDQGSRAAHAGLPRFTDARAEATYPMMRVDLEEPGAPVRVRLEGFNPLVPGDADTSGLPVAVLRYRVHNTTDRTLPVTLAASVENVAGPDYARPRSVDLEDVAERTQQWREEPGRAGVLLSGGDPRERDPGSGSLALAAAVEPGDLVSHRTGWRTRRWNAGLLDFWAELESGGPMSTPDDARCPVGTVAVSRDVPPGGSTLVVLVLSWHFPHRYGWKGLGAGGPDGDGWVGNHYATRHDDAWHVATDVLDRLPELERRTVAFVSTVAGSDVPTAVAEAALSSISVLRTQTCFRTVAGHLHGWEGCFDSAGSCHGSCTHVWNYEQVTGSLFADLARSMREVDYLHGTRDDGLMAFRSPLPLDTEPEWVAAADGQLGTLVRLYREWRTSGDEAWLRRLWPAARRTLEFCWVPGGWDADQDGVMEGTQHNTMDIEYHGPNPEVGTWYLAGLAAASSMARHLGDDGLADRCDRLRSDGSRWIDQHLFTGEHYRQQVRPPGDARLADGLQLPGVGSDDPSRPDFQLDGGCLVDQTVGQVAADHVGLGDLLDREHQRRALVSILRYNDRHHPAARAPAYRSYAVEDEPGLVLASYPVGDRPRRPFPYFSEVWTGLEHTVAAALVQAGMPAEALQVVEDVRSRYDGTVRNPFDEIECGHHYVRSMAAWGTLTAWSGVRWDAVTGTVSVDRVRTGVHLLLTGRGYGTVAIDDGGVTVTLLDGPAEQLAAVVLSDGRRWSCASRLEPRAAVRLDG